MANKKNNIHKLLAFTTATIAIIGSCYVYKDKLKKSKFYQTASNKLLPFKDFLNNKILKNNDCFEEDDFESDFTDDFADVFSNANHTREYTSITINAKTTEDTDSSSDDIVSIIDEPDSFTFKKPEKSDSSNQSKDASTISATSKEEKLLSENAKAYEYENLSDASEDPDVLEEQDILDF